MFLDRMSYLGSGSPVIGIVILGFAFIGLAQAFAAFMMWGKYFFDNLEKKADSSWKFWLPIIVSTFGWGALFKVLSMFA
jgi:hypothetical protein